MNTMKQDQNDGRLTDLAKLESDIAAAMPERAPLPSIKAPPVPTGPMPDYVEHQDGVPRVGALSAEAVVRDYEAAAKEIEAMGAEMIEAARKCEAMTAEVHHGHCLTCTKPLRPIVRMPRGSSSASRIARS